MSPEQLEKIYERLNCIDKNTAATTIQMRESNARMQTLNARVRVMHEVLYGNGKPENGVLTRVHKLEWGAGFLKKAFWLVIGTIVSVVALTFKDRV